MNEKKEFINYATKHARISGLALNDYTSAMGRSKTVVSPNAMTPYVMEERQLNVTQLDVFSRLMMDRIIFLGTEINDVTANIISAQLLYLESVDSKKGISIYINSPGGSVTSGLGIYDVMNYIKPSITTVNVGMAASMAFVLAVAGNKGSRMSLPHSRFMQHQPLGGAYGQSSDIQIAAREIEKCKVELYEIIAHHTGQEYDKVHTDCDRDYWMTAVEAKEYGCVDTVFKGVDRK